MTHSSTISWSILILLTIFAFIFGGFELGNMTIVGVILLSTIIKSQIVIDYFMGLHQVRWRWRIQCGRISIFTVFIVDGMKPQDHLVNHNHAILQYELNRIAPLSQLMLHI